MEFFRPALLSSRLKETSHFRFRKDRKDRDTVSVRRRKHFPDSVAESEDFLFSRKRPRRVRAWSHRGSNRDPKTDRDRQKPTARDPLFVDARVGFPERPSFASRAHANAFRRDRWTVRQRAASNT